MKRAGRYLQHFKATSISGCMSGCERPHVQRTVDLAARKSSNLKLLAFDEYCRFNTSAFF
jgi:hypothetical protein